MSTSTTVPNADLKRQLRYVLLAALTFGLAMGLFIGLTTGSGYYGFHGGFLSGFAFGWAVKRLLKVTTSTPCLAMDGRAAGFHDDESIVMHGAANHFKGIEAVGGKLFLTNKRLRFRSHKLNVQAHDESFAVEDIRTVEPSRTLGIIPNGLLVHLHDGRRERFVLMNRATWLNRLGELTRRAPE